MNKKGFTLVELLAVIVILAIIALIAIPLIGNVIEKAKIGALESSVNGLVESANMYYANNTIKGETVTETTFDFEDGEQISDKKLEYKGKVYNGKLILHANGEVAVCIDDEEHYAYKNKDIDEIVSGIGSCYYDGTTGDFSSNSSINDLRGKTVVATDVIENENSILVKIPEEGHYDKNSIIDIPISELDSNLGGYKKYTVNVTDDTLRTFTVNVSDLPNYNKLTKENFAILKAHIWANERGAGVMECTNYDNTTGIATFSINISGSTSAPLFNSHEMTVLVFW